MIRRTMHSIYGGRDNNVMWLSWIERYGNKIRLMRSTIIRLPDFCYTPLVVKI